MGKNLMKKFTGFIFCALFLTVTVSASAAYKPMTAQELMRSRSVVIFVGGTRVGDMVLGSNAKLQFQFIDRKLSEGIYSDHDSYLDELVSNIGFAQKASRNKCNLVILIYRAENAWTFDPDKLTVNGEQIPKKQIYTSLLSKPVGRIEGETQDSIAFGVPRADSKPGSTIIFGYGDETAEFVVPKK